MITFAEPPFARVWAAIEPGRPVMILGLEFDGRTVEGWVHNQVYADPGMAEARALMLRELAEIVLDEDRHYQAAMTGPA